MLATWLATVLTDSVVLTGATMLRALLLLLVALGQARGMPLTENTRYVLPDRD